MCERVSVHVHEKSTHRNDKIGIGFYSILTKNPECVFGMDRYVLKRMFYAETPTTHNLLNGGEKRNYLSWKT